VSDVSGAAEAFSGPSELTPTNPKLRTNLGLAYQDLGRDREPVEEYRECLRLDRAGDPFRGVEWKRPVGGSGS